MFEECFGYLQNQFRIFRLQNETLEELVTVFRSEVRINNIVILDLQRNLSNFTTLF